MKDKPPLVKAPRFVVFANIVLDGQTHNKKSYAAKEPFEVETGQSFMDVYEGTVMAASAVTEALSQVWPPTRLYKMLLGIVLSGFYVYDIQKYSEKEKQEISVQFGKCFRVFLSVK